MAKKKLINQMPAVNTPGVGSYSASLIGQMPVASAAKKALTMPQAGITPGVGASGNVGTPKIKSYSEFMQEQTQPQGLTPLTQPTGSYSAYVNGQMQTDGAQAKGLTQPMANSQLKMLQQRQGTASNPKASVASAGNNTYQNYVKNAPQKTNETVAGGLISSYDPKGGGESTSGEEPTTDNEVKTVETNGSNGGSSYTDLLKEQQQSITDQYNADVDYAAKQRDEAYAKANDAYDIAVRDANANFRTNQPTYGATAENMLGAGLTGSGYSDYLAGKAYEARTDEVNAARSQQSYAKQLADSNYDQMIYQADTNKRAEEADLNNYKLNYSQQLNSEYKAKLDSLVQGIVGGVYNSSVAEGMLKDYTVDGVVSDDAIEMLKEAQAMYWREKNNSVAAEFINWMQTTSANGDTISREAAYKYLKDNTTLKDDELDVYVNTFFDENGNLIESVVDAAKGENVKDEPQNKDEPQDDNVNQNNTGTQGNTGNQGGSEQSRWQGDEEIVQGNARFKNDALGARNDFSAGDNFNVVINGKTYRVESGGELTDETVKSALDSASIEDGEVFSYGDQAFIKKNGTYYEIDTRVFRPQAESKLVDAINQNEAASNGDSENVGKYSYTTLASPGVFNSNADPKVNKTLAIETLDGKLRVKVDAVLNNQSSVYKAAEANGLKDGQSFIHGEDVYLKKGEKVYMIAEGKHDYDKLKGYLEKNIAPVSDPGQSAELVSNGSADKPYMIKVNGYEFNVNTEGNIKPSAPWYKAVRASGVEYNSIFEHEGKYYFIDSNGIIPLDVSGVKGGVEQYLNPTVKQANGVEYAGVTTPADSGNSRIILSYETSNGETLNPTMLVTDVSHGPGTAIYEAAKKAGYDNGSIITDNHGNIYWYSGDSCYKIKPWNDSGTVWDNIIADIENNNEETPAG